MGKYTGQHNYDRMQRRRGNGQFAPKPTALPLLVSKCKHCEGGKTHRQKRVFDTPFISPGEPFYERVCDSCDVIEYEH